MTTVSTTPASSFSLWQVFRLGRSPETTMLFAVVFLVVFIWTMALPLSYLPSPIGGAAEQFADGTRTTVLLTVLAGIFGNVFGVLAGLGKLSKFRVIRSVSDFYVWIFRGTPLLLQILFVWLVVPDLIPLSDFSCAVVALSLNAGAYNAECVRAGILAVPSGQIEGARALGLKSHHIFLDIVFPQAMRVALPALANNLASLVKDSSLAYVISIAELTMVGYHVQSESYQPIPVFITSASVYLVLTTLFTMLTGALEAKLMVGQKR